MSTTDKATLPHWRYRLLFTVLGPFLIMHSLWQGFTNKDNRLAKQRLGLSLPQRNDRPLWIHMASVGEVNAAYPLIKEIQRQHPKLPIIVSTITPTGAATARQKLGDNIEHFYLPLDFNYATAAIVRKIRPRCLIVMETELWPRLYYQCSKQNIPLLIVNGRLSQKTLDRPAWVHAFYQRTLKNVTRVFARSENDARHFIQLGSDPDKVETVGNIKFADNSEAKNSITAIQLPRPYIVAASTHDDEELQLSRHWLNSELHQTHLLVIVPRHPQRKQVILQQLNELHANIAVRSNTDEITTNTQIYLADTFGELKQFIAGAELTFIGGSLIPHGGQNVLEVAQLGKPAFFGPHMENFIEEKELLLKQKAAIEVSNAQDLISKIKHHLDQPEILAAIGQRAKEAVTANEDIAARYLEALRSYLSAES